MDIRMYIHTYLAYLYVWKATDGVSKRKCKARLWSYALTVGIAITVFWVALIFFSLLLITEKRLPWRWFLPRTTVSFERSIDENSLIGVPFEMATASIRAPPVAILLSTYHTCSENIFFHNDMTTSWWPFCLQSDTLVRLSTRAR